MRLIVVLLSLLLATTAIAQSVEFSWTQPTETVDGYTIPDDYILHYLVMVATPTDTTEFGQVPAPPMLADPASAVIPVEFFTPTAIRVTAVDPVSREGLFSSWSDPVEVDPGVLNPPGTPSVVQINLGD